MPDAAVTMKPREDEPLGPRCTAAVGATTTCLSVWVKSRTLMKPPGQSCNSRLANSALSLIVPVVASAWRDVLQIAF